MTQHVTQRASVVWLRFFPVFLGIFCGACTPRIAGTDDVELAYETDAVPSPTDLDDGLRTQAMARLSARRISADVTQEGRVLRVVVARTMADVTDELVTWTGTLRFATTDPTYELTPHDTSQLIERTVPLPDGRVERHWEGSYADVTRAIQTWATDAGHRIVGEPLWETAHGVDPPRWRTRVVRVPFTGELGDGALIGSEHDGTLRVRADTGSKAAAALARHGVAKRSGSDGEEIVLRGRTSLGTPTYDADGLVLGFGTGIESYGRAEEEKRVLTSPRLPALHPTQITTLPPNTTLAVACLVVPFLLSIAWLAFVRRFDRAHPEPLWLVLVTFVFGALATIPAGLVELAFARMSPWLDPRVVPLGGQAFAFPLSLVVMTLVVGFTEEGAKFVATTFATRRPEFDEPVDGILYGMVASLGFASVENVHYFAASRMAMPLVIARCFMSIPAHLFFGAIWGYALGMRLVDPKVRVRRFFLLAAVAHGLFDALLSTNGAVLLAVTLNVILAALFVMFVQTALTYGVVDARVEPSPQGLRSLFRVGKPSTFSFAAVAFHLLAFGLFMLGGYYQLARYRPELPFVLGSTVLLVLLGVAALTISKTLPLDVAVDDTGVTFGGTSRPWSKIHGATEEGDHVVLTCEAGPLLLGPAPSDVRARMLNVLRERLAPSDVSKI